MGLYIFQEIITFYLKDYISLFFFLKIMIYNSWKLLKTNFFILKGGFIISYNTK